MRFLRCQNGSFALFACKERTVRKRPNFGHSATVTHSGSFWAGSGLSALEFTFGKTDIRGAISRCEALL